jgi:hypothetical protein
MLWLIGPIQVVARSMTIDLHNSWAGAVRNAIGIRYGVFPGNMKLSFQGGKANWLINGFCCEGLPTIHLAPADLSRGEQRSEHHRGGVGRRQHGLGFYPPLKFLVQPLDRVGRMKALRRTAIPSGVVA